MYWCKKPGYSLLMIFVGLAACKQEVKPYASPKYFDLKKYFTAEAARLTKQNKTVAKIVDYNGQPEQKQVIIKNWSRELALFTESDINKPAWRDSYKTTKTDSAITYTATDSDLRTRRITVVLSPDKVKSIQVVNFTKNVLYQTRDSLFYYPDSVYVIVKHQYVRMLGANNYKIVGKLK